MLEYYSHHISINPDGVYSTWDAEIGYWLKERGVESFIPLMHYGEHGGRWNSEHKTVGLHKPHRAVVLAGPLAFNPIYADSVSVYVFTRLTSYLYGLARLFAGRLVALRDIRRKGGLGLLMASMLRFSPWLQLALIKNILLQSRL
jgi:hypothetical protein